MIVSLCREETTGPVSSMHDGKGKKNSREYPAKEWKAHATVSRRFTSHRPIPSLAYVTSRIRTPYWLLHPFASSSHTQTHQWSPIWNLTRMPLANTQKKERKKTRQGEACSLYYYLERAACACLYLLNFEKENQQSKHVLSLTATLFPPVFPVSWITRSPAQQHRLFFTWQVLLLYIRPKRQRFASRRGNQGFQGAGDHWALPLFLSVSMETT